MFELPVFWLSSYNHQAMTTPHNPYCTGVSPTTPNMWGMRTNTAPTTKLVTTVYTSCSGGASLAATFPRTCDHHPGVVQYNTTSMATNTWADSVHGRIMDACSCTFRTKYDMYYHYRSCFEYSYVLYPLTYIQSEVTYPNPQNNDTYLYKLIDVHVLHTTFCSTKYSSSNLVLVTVESYLPIQAY